MLSEPDYSPALLGKAEALRMTRRYEEYFNVLDKYIVTEDTPAGAKGDYLMAVVQRTDPKFVSTFQPQLDTVMNKVLKVHPKDSILLHLMPMVHRPLRSSRTASRKVHRSPYPLLRRQIRVPTN